MFDAPHPTLQRVRGEAGVALSVRGGATRLDRLAQAGSAKAFLPRAHMRDPEVVFLNTAGGLTGGDRLCYGLRLGPGAHATAATQTAERVYRAADGTARMAVQIEVGAGGRLDWLPQETILFDGAALDRHTRIALAGDAELLFVETLVLGRTAMGERVRRLALTDRREVLRDGRPVLVEPLAIDAAALAAPGAAGLSGRAVLATLAFLGRGAEDALGPVRGCLGSEPDGVRAAATGFDGKLILRATARDGWPLRRLLARVLGQLRRDPLPRVWQM